MEMQLAVRDAVAELKLRIIAQCELAASMARSGDNAKARSARDMLLKLLFKLDLMELRP